MRQYIPTSRTGLLAAANVAYHAALNHAVAIPLVHNKAEFIADDREAAMLARDARDVERVKLRKARHSLESVRKEGREFGMLARDILKTELGRVHSGAWDQTGFKGSFRVPVRADHLERLMEALNLYFLDHPEKQKVAIGISAAKAGQLYNRIRKARASVQAQKAALERVTAERKEKFALLYRRISNLVKELSQLLPADDCRWIAFGLNMPGKKQTPEMPENLEAVLVRDGAVALKWKKAPRAAHYRVWKQVTGVDPAPVAVGSSADLDFTLEGLESGGVEFSVSAVNSGGESSRSQALRLTIGGLPVPSPSETGGELASKLELAGAELSILGGESGQHGAVV